VAITLSPTVTARQLPDRDIVDNVEENNMFIAQLPQSVQALILANAEFFLTGMDLTEAEIAETIENIKSEKICNVLNDDGTFIF
jgi:hypothetical protein